MIVLACDQCPTAEMIIKVKGTYAFVIVKVTCTNCGDKRIWDFDDDKAPPV